MRISDDRCHVRHSKESILQGTHARGSPEHLLENINVQMGWYYAYKIHQGYSISKMNLYSRELTHGHTGSPEHLLER